MNKNRAILDAAGELFLDTGYERTSMEQVARLAGVSKQTVYSHFTNKERLFRAVIAGRVADYFPDDEKSRSGAETSHRINETETTRAGHYDMSRQLQRLGCRYMHLILSDDAVALFRLLVAAPQGQAKLAALFYEEGPGRLGEMFRAEIIRACHCGILLCDDPDDAAKLFGTLLRGEVFLQRVLGLADEMSADAIERYVAKTVAAFLRLYPQTV